MKQCTATDCSNMATVEIKDLKTNTEESLCKQHLIKFCCVILDSQRDDRVRN